jgi:hypothetical protein
MKLLGIVKFPIIDFLWAYFGTVVLSTILIGYNSSILYALLVVFSLMFLFFIQGRYTKISIFEHQLLIEYPISFFKKPKTCEISDVNYIVFQYHSLYDNPYFMIYVRNGKKIKVYLPLPALKNVKMYFDILPIQIKIAEHRGQNR